MAPWAVLPRDTEEMEGALCSWELCSERRNSLLNRHSLGFFYLLAIAPGSIWSHANSPGEEWTESQGQTQVSYLVFWERQLTSGTDSNHSFQNNYIYSNSYYVPNDSGKNEGNMGLGRWVSE